MRFAVLLPWWGYALAFGAAALLAWAAYARAAAALTGRERALLVGLRATALSLIVAALLRPVAILPSDDPRRRVVPLLVDASRSMGVADEGTETRLDRARAVAGEIIAGLGPAFRIELLAFGDAVTRASLDQLTPSARRSNLSVAVEETVERFRHEDLAGVIVLSDGGDTSGRPIEGGRVSGARVFPIGIGASPSARDRAVLNLTAGEAVLPEAALDLSVSFVSRGFGTAPVDVRLSANGRPVEVRRVAPAADGAPVHQVFTVSPTADQPTVYTVDLVGTGDELSGDNNRRSVLVPPQVGRRKILIVEGAPGFEHTFLKRALASDRGLDVDAVVRKGQNDDGQPTFFVQAGESRAAALSSGYPSTPDALFQYDAIVFGNVEAEFFTREQLALTSRFVAERGGGLLVLGARSFEHQGLSATSLAEALPLDITDRRTAAARAPEGGEGQAVNTPAVTSDGAGHPATRLAPGLEASRAIWKKLPALASVSLVGGPRPGAQILAVTSSPGGDAHPLIAVQRYGQGRTMMFAGEASWRWRMLRPASDTSYDTIWRQLVRWLAASTPGTVSMPPMAVGNAGDVEPLSVTVRSGRFEAVTDAQVSISVTDPDGAVRTLEPALEDARAGRYTVPIRFDQEGVYRVDAEARRGDLALGTATRHVLVGGADLEMADLSLNEPVLQRLAEATGGRYLRPDGTAELRDLLKGDEQERATEMKDLWHNAWTLFAIVGLLAAEWLVRRRCGLA
ncbi:MAG TPA: glutamine amidotransferase [Vicinamibacterales bacterium]|nr:glutamine amidotransferase [Vicinamibacterales bacterium]